MPKEGEGAPHTRFFRVVETISVGSKGEAYIKTAGVCLGL